MFHINNQLELAACLLYKYLSLTGLVDKFDDEFWKERSSKNIVVQIPTREDVSRVIFKQSVSTVEIIGLDMNRSEKCMLGIYSGDESLGQGIFHYKKLVENPPNFPILSTEVFQLFNSIVLRSFQEKFHLLDSSKVQQQDVITCEGKDGKSTSTKNTTPTIPPFSFDDLKSTSNKSKRPNDMPDFDDENQIQSGPGIPITGEFGVPGLGTPLGGYGDQDLYPNGMRFPQNYDPLARPHPTGRGGMIFDPFNTGDASSDRSPHPGAPPFPGAKYEDPYGRSNMQGGGGGFI